MKNKFGLLLLLLLLSTYSAFAQKCHLTGKLVNGKGQPIEFASVALLHTDSTVISGVMTDERGLFSLNVPGTGNYIIKLSFIGYNTQYKNISLREIVPAKNVGVVKLVHATTLLGTATVTATAAKVEQVEDTTMFNASAYRVPEGSTLEALVKQLPGVEIEDDGTITWNGKQIKEFLVNGKDFFKGQKDIALQNLPSDWVSKIKAYDKQSEYAEQTGIDDGEEFPVLDIVTKKELNQTVITNTDLAYGTKDRYFGKLFVTRFTDRSRVSAYGSANNVSDKSFGGKRKRHNEGLVARKNAGTDFYWNNGIKKHETGHFELGGNVNYNHANTDIFSTTESENFLSGGHTSSFRSGVNRSNISTTNVGTNLRLEWNPDTMTMIQFRPSFSHNDSQNGGQSLGATFSDDPFKIDHMVSPLDSIIADLHSPLLDSIAVNRNIRTNKGDRYSNSANLSLNVVRRLKKKGRNVSLNISGGYSLSENNSFSISNIDYYNGKSGKYLNQYSKVPANNWNYRLQFGYVEPLWKKWFAEIRYSYSNKYNESERSRYNLDRLDAIYGAWCDSLNYPVIGTLPEDDTVLQMVRDSMNSQYATYRYYNHSANFNIRYNTKEIRFTAGVSLNPERTKMAYERPGQCLDTVIIRKVFNVTPQLNFRYRLDKRNSIEARYRGASSQPSMTNLLAVVDNSHPLNVTMGNPGLDPSWNNALEMGYRGYRTRQQQSLAVGFSFNQTKDAVSQLSVYDESTGVRYHRPQNINGNWNIRTNFLFNTGLGEKKNFTLATNTNVLYNHAVGYISSFSSGTRVRSNISNSSSEYSYYDEIFNNAQVQKNTTKTFGVRERLNFDYRKDWLEVGTFGTVNFNHSRANLRTRNDRDTWNFSYGAKTNLMFDWGLSFSTDIRVNSRRGYPNATMNTDEWLWNAQVAYSFLKKKSATISFQCYDILQQQSNVSHSISAVRRSDSWNNDIHSYYMIHFIYKFRYLGGKAKKEKWNKKHHKDKHNKSILDDENVIPSDAVML